MKYTRHYESQDEPTSLAVQDVQPEYKEHHGHEIQHRLTPPIWQDLDLPIL